MSKKIFCITTNWIFHCWMWIVFFFCLVVRFERKCFYIRKYHSERRSIAIYSKKISDTWQTFKLAQPLHLRLCYKQPFHRFNLLDRNKFFLFTAISITIDFGSHINISKASSSYLHNQSVTEVEEKISLYV